MKKSILAALFLAGTVFGAGNETISNLKLATDANGNGKNFSSLKINGLDFVNSGGTAGPFTFAGTGTVLLTNGSASALTVNASGFNGNLTPSDDTIQEIAQKLDDLISGGSSGITDLVQDATPQLGGDLDLNGHQIVGLIPGTNIQAWSLNLDNWAAVGTTVAFRTFAGSASSLNFYNALTDKNGDADGKVLFAEGTINITAGRTLEVPISGTIGTMAFQASTGNSIDIQKGNGTGGLAPVDSDEVFQFVEGGVAFIPYHEPSQGWFQAQFDRDTTLAASDPNRIAPQQAVKVYADGKILNTSYNEATWDGDTTHAPSMNAVRDEIEALVIGGGGSGTVTAFTAGTFSPLFTTSVSNGSTTPNLDFVASTFAANTWFGNPTGSAAAPIAATSAQVLTSLQLAATDTPSWANVKLGASALTWAATTNVNFTADRFKQLTLAGNTTFTGSNMQAGKNIVVNITGDGSTRNLTWPSWNWVGTTAPTTLAASKKAMLVLTALGTTDGSVSAQWFLQDQASGGGGLANVVDDATPQLGGDLDLNGHVITGAPSLSGSNSWTGTNTHTSSTEVFTGNINAAAWTTSGLKIKDGGSILTDTTSTGTVSTGYTYLYGGNTIAASTTSTFTTYYEAYFKDPSQGTNVTLTNKWALGADSAKINGAMQVTGSLTAGAGMLWSGVISPTALSADVNDYNPTSFSTASIVRQDVTGGNWNVTGLSGGATGRIINIINISAANSLTLKDQSASSSGSNRFLLGSDIVLGINQSIILRYDGTTNRWRQLDNTPTTVAGSLSVSGQTGLVSVTGITSTNRIKTVRDAADTILELGGSYTPTGNWTNMVLVTPNIGTPSAGTLNDSLTYGHDLTAVPNQTGGFTEFFVTGSDATTASTSPVDITGLATGTLSTSTKYEIEVVLDVGTSADANGNKYAIAVGGTGSPLVRVIGVGSGSTTSNGTPFTIASAGSATNALVTGSGNSGAVTMKGFVTTGTGTPTISIQHAHGAAAGLSTVRVGSILKIKKAHP